MVRAGAARAAPFVMESVRVVTPSALLRVVVVGATPSHLEGIEGRLGAPALRALRGDLAIDDQTARTLAIGPGGGLYVAADASLGPPPGGLDLRRASVAAVFELPGAMATLLGSRWILTDLETAARLGGHGAGSITGVSGWCHAGDSPAALAARVGELVGVGRYHVLTFDELHAGRLAWLAARRARCAHASE